VSAWASARDREDQSVGDIAVAFWTWSQPWALRRISSPETVGRQVWVPVMLQPGAGMGFESAALMRVLNLDLAS
jgi:hypothetical protein